MVFPHNGENHENGIKNEKNTVEYQNNNPNNAINICLMSDYGGSDVEWSHQGGTKQKADANVKITTPGNVEIIEEISLKNHKSGTFDWENTTKGVPENIKNQIKEYKEKNKSATEVTKMHRNEVNTILSDSLNNFTHEMIKGMLSAIYDDYPEWILVNKNKEKEFIMFHKDNLEKYFKPKENETYILKKSRAKTSRQIWMQSSDGNEKNTNLRIRLVTNNGVGALLGLSKSNKSSVPCIKIQQDHVDKFISCCKDKTIVKY
tara:strand:+ start:30 stop:812 length:783 start_codon:yes stop_codon:yes gene_type:complete